MSLMIRKTVIKDEKERDRFNSMLSLCKRAGQLVSGEANCENSVRSKKAFLVLLASNASRNTFKKFTNKANYYNVPALILDFSKDDMGRVIGEAQRAVIAVTGSGFAEQLIKISETWSKEFDLGRRLEKD